jgi:hypothetical protein
VVIEQALVHRTEFLGIQRSIVDAARRRIPLAVERQMPEGAQQVAVGDAGVVQFLMGKEFAIERRCIQQARHALIGQHQPQCVQRQPQVVVIGVGSAARTQAAQATHAVVIAVERVAAHQSALFRRQQEEQAIDQAQQLAVERIRTLALALTALSVNRFRRGRGKRRLFPALRPERRAQRSRSRMAQKAIRQDHNRLFHPIAQALTHPPALLDCLLIVGLQQAIGGSAPVRRQAGAVQQAVKQHKIGKPPLIGEDRRQIELHIRLAAHKRRIAQQAQRAPVGDDSPQRLRAIEVLLNQGMRRQARARGRSDAPQLLATTDNVNRNRRFCASMILRLIGAERMRNGERRAVHLQRARIEAQIIAEQPQKRDHPELTGRRGRRIIGGKALQTVLKHLPERAGVVERRSDFTGQAATGRKTKIRRLLPRQIGGGQRLDQVGTEQPALKT